MNTEKNLGSTPSPALQILFLEDDLADRGLVTESLRTEGLACHFTYATGRDDFAAALRRQPFDLILSDYSLPDYDGLSALALARELQPQTPFIAISGTIGEERAIEILQKGATDYVLKNRLPRLGTAIRRALQERRELERRLQAEQSLRRSEQRFREMAATIREVFWSRSADGRQLLYVSPAFEQVWGQPVSVLEKNPDRWIESVWAEDRPRVSQALLQLAQGVPYSLEYLILTGVGAVRWIEERGYPVKSGSGPVERIVGVAVDISERKQLEAQLKQAQKMEAIGQLAGGIAHDFSNMLTVINGYSNLLLDSPALPPAIAESLKQIYVAGGRAASLTRQLLIFSRKGYAQSQLVDLNEIVRDVSPMLGRLIGEHIKLELDLAHGLPPTLADTGMVEQVLMNLAVNGRDAMPRGGHLVISTGSCVTTEADAARHTDARPGPHVWVGVRDTGSGIAPEILGRIFEPFFTTKEEGRGTGLGLATVLGIARQHQGWVEVETEVGTGTFFRVFFPIAEGLAATPATSAIPEAIRGGKEIILVVEDEDSVREYARTVLEMHGYRVLQASSGVEALDVWKWYGDRVSLLLTDLVMPDEISGLELAEKLQAQRPDLKVLFSSGYNPDVAAQMLAARRGYSFLHKPYQPKTLARIVREVLDNPLAGGSRPPIPSTSA